jgi:hypothetical protein
MDEIYKKVRALSKNADENYRKEILDGLRGLALSLEAAPDTMQRLSYQVSLFYFERPYIIVWLMGIQLATRAYYGSDWIRLEYLQYS